MTVISLLKKSLKATIERTGFITRLFFSGVGFIIVLHRITPDPGPNRLRANSDMEITPDQLEEIIQFLLDRSYDVISLDQMVQRLQNSNSKRKFVVFTFDDGYKDNLIHGLPVFKKFNAPFTVYLTTDFPDRKAILWWYLLEDILLNQQRVEFKSGQQINEYPCRNLEEREETFYKIRTTIMNWPQELLYERMTENFTALGIDMLEKTNSLALSWEQVIQLNSDPLVTIGAHTVNHYVLAKLSDEEVKKEMWESKRIIESHLHEQVRHFAYPFGGREEAGIREFRLAKECGFQTAVTGRFATIFPQHKDYLTCLPRIFIHPGWGKEQLLSLVNGTTQFLSHKFHRLITH